MPERVPRSQPSTEAPVVGKPKAPPKAREGYKHPEKKVELVNPLILDVIDTIGQQRAADAWDLATEKYGLSPESAMDYIYGVTDYAKKYFRGYIDEKGFKELLKTINATFNMPIKYDPIVGLKAPPKRIETTGPRIEKAKEILGQERAAEIWNTATKIMGLIPDRATEYVLALGDLVERNMNDSVSDEDYRDMLRKMNTSFRVPVDFNPVVGSGKSRPLDMHSLDAGRAKEDASNVVGRATGIETRIAKPTRKKFTTTSETGHETKDLESELETDYGISPANVYFNLGKVDRDISANMKQDPRYKTWIAELKISEDQGKAEEAKTRRMKKRAIFVPEEQEEVALREGEAKLVEAIKKEDTLKEEQWFEAGDRMTREGVRVRSEILEDANELQQEIRALEGTKNGLEFEISRSERAKRPHDSIDRELEKTTQEINRKVLRYNALISRVEPESSEDITGGKERAAERERLLKEREALYEKISELAKPRRTPEAQKEIETISVRINMTEARLEELAHEFGKTPSRQPPLAERIKGFFKNLVGKFSKPEEYVVRTTPAVRTQRANVAVSPIRPRQKPPIPVRKLEEPPEELSSAHLEEIPEEVPKTSSLMELSKNPDFLRASQRLGHSLHDALAFFQGARGLEYKRTAYEAEVASPDEATEFIVALGAYVVARREKKSSDVMRTRTDVTNIAQRYGIAPSETLRFLSHLIEQKATKTKSKPVEAPSEPAVSAELPKDIPHVVVGDEGPPLLDEDEVKRIREQIAGAEKPVAPKAKERVKPPTDAQIESRVLLEFQRTLENELVSTRREQALRLLLEDFQSRATQEFPSTEYPGWQPVDFGIAAKYLQRAINARIHEGMSVKPKKEKLEQPKKNPPRAATQGRKRGPVVA